MQSVTIYEKNADLHLEKFIQDYLPLVKKIAIFIKRKLPSHIELEDLLQSGLIGLLEAKNNYQPEKGASFETYASIRIRGAILDFLRKNSWAGRETIRMMKRISNAITKIEQHGLRKAAIEDILLELGMTSEEYFKTCQEINMFYVVSLTDDLNDMALADEEKDPEIILQQITIKNNLKAILSTLPEKEQLVLSLYYVEELTFREIGSVLDLTEARICQLHSQAVSRIRFKLQTE